MRAGPLSALSPAEQTFLGLPGPVLQGLLLLVAAVAFGWIVFRRLALLRIAAPDPRTDRPRVRLRRLVRIGFGQSRQPRYPVAGILHILIFAGFLVLSLRSLTLLGEGFVAGFALPGLGGSAGHVYAAIKDWTALVVLLCCAVAAWRRAVVKPARYHDRHATGGHGAEAYVILGLISLLMVADALFEGSALAERGETTAALPLASLASRLLGGLSAPALDGVHLTAFWVHNAALLFFLCYLPVSKHFHVLSALPNVYLSNVEPAGRIKPPRHDVADTRRARAPGRRAARGLHLEAHPRLLHLHRLRPLLRQLPRLRDGDAALAAHDQHQEPRRGLRRCIPSSARRSPRGERRTLLGDIIADGEVWACTTCGACEDACPVLIEYVDKIVDLRRAPGRGGSCPGDAPEGARRRREEGQPVRQDAAQARRLGGRRRGRLLRRPRPEEGRGGRRPLLHRQLLGLRPPHPGDRSRLRPTFSVRPAGTRARSARTRSTPGTRSAAWARRACSRSCARRTRRRSEQREFDRIVTTDPHALNALENDYADLEQPVVHHTQVLAELLASGALKPRPPADDRTYMFHDPCYLGRHNGDLRRAAEGPRSARRQDAWRWSGRGTAASAAAAVRSTSSTRARATRGWGSSDCSMAADAGADVVVTACPFCLINLEDAIKTTGRSETMEVLDLAELVARQVETEA